ncbi:MAG: YegP family protein [Christensenellaceae bacterium]|nr:YegP family protein [Christensenellaceae bacterium]
MLNFELPEFISEYKLIICFALAAVLFLCFFLILRSLLKKKKAKKAAPAEQTEVNNAKAETQTESAKATRPERDSTEYATDESVPDIFSVKKPVAVEESAPQEVKAQKLKLLKEDYAAEGSKTLTEQAKDKGQIVVFNDTNGYYRFKIKTSGGNIVGASQPFQTKKSLITSLRAVEEVALDAVLNDATPGGEKAKIREGRAYYDLFRGNDLNYRYRLYGANLSVLLTSPANGNKDTVLQLITSVRAVAAHHTTVDLSL